jgi:hypothetical protein
MMATRLHQIIAVEKTVKKTEETAFTQAHHMIQKGDVFSGLTKTYQPKDDEGQRLPPESRKVLAFAPLVISEVQSALEKLFDHTATKDHANRFAVADIKVGENTLAKEVPVSTLLWIEKKLVDIRTFVSKLPVLDPMDDWSWDQANQLYRATPYETVRQVKKVDFVVPPGGEATKEHKAQIVQATSDVIEGTWTTTKLSGALAAVDKQRILHRVDELTMAVKRARETANAYEVTDVAIGNTLLNFVFGS